MVRIFVGFDRRQPIAFHVLCSSILRHSSVPVSITPLLLDQLPIERTGLTEFTYSRYLVPWLCDYEGMGVFMDSDMLVTADVAELEMPKAPVAMVNHPDQSYENSSMMVFNNAACRVLTPEYIEEGNRNLQSFEWAEYTDEVDPEWNFLVGYDEPLLVGHNKRPHWPPKLIHYTQGIPEYKECRDCDFANEWFTEKAIMLASVSWIEIMGGSVHAEHVLKRLVK